LFPAAAAPGGSSVDLALGVIERDLVIWEGLERRAALDPRLPEEKRRRLTGLGRELRGLRDCYNASRHPRVRQALLREAVRVTRRMKSLGARLRVRGLDVVAVA
jgi:hypothetical protein